MMEPFYDETFFRLRVINGMLVSFFFFSLFPFFPTSELVIIQTTLYPPQKLERKRSNTKKNTVGMATYISMRVFYGSKGRMIGGSRKSGRGGFWVLLCIFSLFFCEIQYSSLVTSFLRPKRNFFCLFYLFMKCKRKLSDKAN